MNIKTVVVGTKNLVKTECIAEALDSLGIFYRIINIDAPSGIVPQPMDYETALRGVRNRIMHCKKELPDNDMYIAIESGIQYDPLLKKYFDFSYTCVQDCGGYEAVSKSAEFRIRDDVMEHVLQGKNLSEASTLIFNVENVGARMGISGLVSRDLIPRKKLHMQPTIFALTEFAETKHFI